MTAWNEDELAILDATDELEIQTMRSDGSYRKPVIIWMVRLDNDVYVRAVKGVNGKWYRHAADQHRARISAGGIDRDVAITETDDEPTIERIDQAYQSKYNRYAANIVGSTVTDEAKEATLKLTPAK